MLSSLDSIIVGSIYQEVGGLLKAEASVNKSSTLKTLVS